MLQWFKRWRDRPTEAREVDIPPAWEARWYRNRIERETVLDLLQQLWDDLAYAEVHSTLDVSELSPAFVDALESKLSSLGYEIQRGYNGDRDVIRLIVSW